MMNRPVAPRVRLLARSTDDLSNLADLQEIQERLKRHNYDISLRDAHVAWSSHGSRDGTTEAAWEKLPEDDKMLIAIILHHCKIA